MPLYVCPKCGRKVEMPEGRYYCKECGESVLMVKVSPELTFLYPKKGKIRRVEGGFYIVAEGHPAAGEKVKVRYFSYTEEGAIKGAEKVGAPCYIYKLVYSYY